MNERLENALAEYEHNLWADEIRENPFTNIERCAQHFYNLALEDVRKEVERLNNKMKNAPTPTETYKCYLGGRLLGYEDVLNFLDQLSK